MDQRARAGTGVVTLAALASLLPVAGSATAQGRPHPSDELDPLPSAVAGTAALDDVLRRRRSVRSFDERALSPEQVGQLCWAAQGTTDANLALRTVPSAGALYPLEVYVVLPSGVFHYVPRGHRLTQVEGADRRAGLARAALGQDFVASAAADIVITGVVARTRAKYGRRAERYVHLEAGHAAQNVLLEATALGLAAVPVGAFDVAGVRRIIGAAAGETPLYVLPIGYPSR